MRQAHGEILLMTDVRQRLDTNSTGALYAIRRDLVSPIPPGTLLDDVYPPLEAFFPGYRLILDDRALA